MLSTLDQKIAASSCAPVLRKKLGFVSLYLERFAALLFGRRVGVMHLRDSGQIIPDIIYKGLVTRTLCSENFRGSAPSGALRDSISDSFVIIRE